MKHWAGPAVLQEQASSIDERKQARLTIFGETTLFAALLGN